MIKGIQLIPHNTKIDFVGFRKIFFTLSAIIVLGSIILAFTKGLNLGIDFKGGFSIEARTDQPADFGAMRTRLENLGLGSVKLQSFGSDHDVMIRMEQQPGGEKAQNAALEKVKQTLGDGVHYRRVETVGPKVSQDLIENACWALVLAMIGMLIYVWLRFEWQFSVCAISALFHDTFAIMGLYAITGLEFNETAIIAILTTVGYSINDTVVIYDRIRENLQKFKTTPFGDVLNLSINETLSRTTLTSGTTIIALLCLYLFGGSVIEVFVLPIMCGVIVGTYSSICIAAPFLLYLKVHRGEETPVLNQEPLDLG